MSNNVIISKDTLRSLLTCAYNDENQSTNEQAVEINKLIQEVESTLELQEEDSDLINELPLEAGHYKTLINRFKKYAKDRKDALVTSVMYKREDACKEAIQIYEAERWIEIFQEESDLLLFEAPSEGGSTNE